MRKKSAALTIAAAFICLCCACGTGVETSQYTAPESIAGHAWDYSMDIQYAEGFRVDYYEGDYALITIGEDGQFLVIPEGQSLSVEEELSEAQSVYREQTLPEGLDESVTVLTQPVTDIYLAASAVMDMFVSLDALSNIRFSALDADGWYIDEAVESMEAGDILYAGKYSAPDYELILSEGCSLAIENTMIYHTPEVKEELESLGIPVLVDYSSYETDPLGRMEWVKLYGVLTGETELAEQVFETQAALYVNDAEEEETGINGNSEEEEEDGIEWLMDG
ncbi:MAG: ABC transporter substrate-binding protein, partial [Clostridiales bacterium]|nr:ABC transporter substrate-binding protein [Clostridiales bacterium]